MSEKVSLKNLTKIHEDLGIPQRRGIAIEFILDYIIELYRQDQVCLREETLAS